MNSVSARITSITKANRVKAIALEAGGITFSVLVLEPDGQAMTEGTNLRLLFKETEVSLGLNTDLEISLRNRIPGTIAQIEPGRLLCRVSLDTPVGIINAIITTASAEQLGLKAGGQAVAYIKTNDIMLSRE